MRTVAIALLALLAVKMKADVAFHLVHYQLSHGEVKTVAACLVLEAASQGEAGMRGVMSVIRNRAHGDPVLFYQVILEPRQFSALNQVTSGAESLSAAIRRASLDRTWAVATRVAIESQSNTWTDTTGGALYYTRTSERVYWTRKFHRTAIIGCHSFYR